MLNSLSIDGRIVIGEGERDEAPMLFIGEKLGKAAGPKIDIAVDPLEGTNLCATGSPDSIAVLAAAERGGLLHAPDVYMEKLVVGPTARGTIHIDASVLVFTLVEPGGAAGVPTQLAVFDQLRFTPELPFQVWLAANSAGVGTIMAHTTVQTNAQCAKRRAVRPKPALLRTDRKKRGR